MNSKPKKSPLEQPTPRCPEGISDCPVAAQVATLQQEIARLADLVRTDTLTGLANYRFLSRPWNTKSNAPNVAARPPL